jgi:hypothetical protein
MDKDEEARIKWIDSSKRQTTPAKPTAEQLVPDPPATMRMRKRDWSAYYQADLVEAIGVEYIDPDPQPPPWVLNKRSSKRPKKGTALQLHQQVSESRLAIESTIDSRQPSPRTTGAMASALPNQ